jgi:hypothetical protein
LHEKAKVMWLSGDEVERRKAYMNVVKAASITPQEHAQVIMSSKKNMQKWLTGQYLDLKAFQEAAELYLAGNYKGNYHLSPKYPGP